MSEGDPGSEVRRRSVRDVLDANVGAAALAEPMLRGDRPPRQRVLVRVLTVAVIALVLGVIAYEAWLAPKEDPDAWSPPAGLSREQTPPWLRTLCSDRTRELCATADRARNPSDCAALRATLRSLEGVEHRLDARGLLASNQRWVLIELYGQGHELCQFKRGDPTAHAK